MFIPSVRPPEAICPVGLGVLPEILLAGLEDPEEGLLHVFLWDQDWCVTEGGAAQSKRPL